MAWNRYGRSNLMAERQFSSLIHGLTSFYEFKSPFKLEIVVNGPWLLAETSLCLKNGCTPRLDPALKSIAFCKGSGKLSVSLILNCSFDTDQSSLVCAPCCFNSRHIRTYIWYWSDVLKKGSRGKCWRVGRATKCLETSWGGRHLHRMSLPPFCQSFLKYLFVHAVCY